MLIDNYRGVLYSKKSSRHADVRPDLLDLSVGCREQADRRRRRRYFHQDTGIYQQQQQLLQQLLRRRCFRHASSRPSRGLNHVMKSRDSAAA